MAPHEAERYKIRSSAERANSRLKEDFGASNVMVKGHSKVTLHLMFGVIVLFADQLLRLVGLDCQRSEALHSTLFGKLLILQEALPFIS